VPSAIKFAKSFTPADGATIVAAVSGKRIRVLSVVVASVGAGSTSFKSNTTDISALFATNSTTVALASDLGLFETVAGEALKLGIIGAANYINVSYVEVDPSGVSPMVPT